MTDYKSMPAMEMLDALGDDAAKWTDAYLQFYPNGCADRDVMLGWFANAIEHSSLVRKREG